MSSLTNSTDVYANTVVTDYLYVNGVEITADGMVGSPGSIAQSYEGTWSSTVDYLPNDVVVYGGSSYVALAPNTNSTPSLDNPLWGVLAVVGSVGPASTVPGPPGGDSTVPGPAGPPGEDASVISTYRSVWSAATAYMRGDIVIYSELNNSVYSCYLCIADNTNQTPPSPGNTTSYWAFVATHGAQGQKGDPGDTGPRGPAGQDGSDGSDGRDGRDGSDAILDIGSIVTAVLGSAALASMELKIDGLVTAVGTLQGELSAQQLEITGLQTDVGALNTKTFFQSASTVTLTTSFGGTSLVKTASNGLSSAVSLNAGTASTFSLGAVVNGGLTADQITVAGAVTAPGMTISATGLQTTIGSGAASTVTIGNPLQLSTVYINGTIYMPNRDAQLNSFGFAQTNGFLSQF